MTPWKLFVAIQGIIHLEAVWSVGASIILGNDLVELEFDESTGELLGMRDHAAPSETLAKGINLWTTTFVDKFGILEMGPRSYGKGTLERVGDLQTCTLSWENIALFRSGFMNTSVATVNVNFTASLQDTSAISQWSVAVMVTSGLQIGIWEAVVLVPVSIGGLDDGQLFYPSGFGLTYTNPRASGRVSSTYPGGRASMQFMSLGALSSTRAVYVAALDVMGEAKLLSYKPSTDGSTSSSLEVLIYPENAGVPLAIGSRWRAPYSIGVGVLSDIDPSDGRPLWYQAAAVYRPWVLASARWVQNGPIATRVSAFPSWYTNTSVWLNTHWQCHDVFNATGGDPYFVLPYTTKIAELLQEPSLSLHWYEWQQGPDPSPDARYLFDTHYPDYFPARAGFADGVAGLLDIGVSTFPYINGRIFDVNSDSFRIDDGLQYCSKSTAPKTVDPLDPRPLEPYLENYGSGTSFCVSNPFTSYWQEKAADIVEELVFDYGVAGVYIDQIGSASPTLCWDAKHDHSLGNGNFWVEGYSQMLQAINERLAGTSTRPMVTEDNAESYMDSLQGYLTLNAYKTSFSQAIAGSAMLPDTTHIAPAFPVIYGGYYVGFGAQWFQEDFKDHDWWCAKLATMLVTGSQLGWFSLVGINNDPLDSCGPMGVGDMMLDPLNADLIDYLRLLARSRAAVVEYLLHGRMNQPLASIVPPPQTFVHQSSSDYDSVQSGVWSSADSQSILVLLCTTTSRDYSGTIKLNFEQWGLSQFSEFEISTILSSDGKIFLGTAPGPSATWPVDVPGRSVLMLEIIPKLLA